MITTTDFYSRDPSELYIPNIDNVMIIGVVPLRNGAFFGIDKVIYDNYGISDPEQNTARQNNSVILNHVLNFNGIPDLDSLQGEMFILLPDLESLIMEYELLDNFTEEGVPGINSEFVSPNISRSISVTKTAFIPENESEDGDTVIANPKLSIKCRKVKYNPSTGKVTF